MTAVETQGSGLSDLAHRYSRADLRVFTADEAVRFASLGADLSSGPLSEALAWEVMYRLEPQLYDRWATAERLHPGILDWLPANPHRVLEVGAGSGRMTVELVRRCEELVATEPVPALRQILGQRLAEQGATNAHVIKAFADSLPVSDAWADLVVACSVLTPDLAHGGEAGLRELERACAPGGRVVIVWPNNLDWLAGQGYSYVSFPGDMWLEFDSPEEAYELTHVLYPRAAAEIRRRGDRRVPYSTIGINPPRDLAYRLIDA
jgi:SAM-dependent methyltransferase